MAPQLKSLPMFYVVCGFASAAFLVVALSLAVSDTAAHGGFFFTAAGAAVTLGLCVYSLRRSRRGGRRPS